jgi:serine/threonine protein kinase
VTAEAGRSGGAPAGSGNDSLQEVLDSILLRWRKGEEPALAEYEARHPALAAELREAYPALAFLGRFGTGAPAGAGLPATVGSTDAGEPGPAPPAALERLGGYRLGRELGRGGMGIVYEAEEDGLRRRVAVKVLPFHALMDPRRIERFRREARAAAGLQHPGIVPVYGAGEEGGIHYYVMQRIEGESLDAVLDEVRRWKSGQTPRPGSSRSAEIALKLLSDSASTVLREDWAPAAEPPAPFAARPPSGPPPAQATPPPEYYRGIARLGWQVAVALAYAHGRGVLHRDIKPGNILLDVEGNAWIADFGLARAEDAEELTRTGEVVGTLRYMAPECFRGRADPRSDIYSLGLTLYELLTLEPAWSGEERRPALSAGRSLEPLPPRRREARVPRPLERIVLKAARHDPAERYQSAGEVAVDLERFLGGRPVLARLPGRRRAALGLLARHRAGLAAALVALAAAAAAAWAAAGAHRPDGPECMVAADLDGDGDLDLAVSALRTSSVTVLRNDGKGGLDPERHLETGPWPMGVEAGDLDADGRIDLVATSAQSTRLTVFPGEGKAGLGGGRIIDVLLGTMRVAIADLDGDARPDIIATRRDHRLAVLRNVGKGAFSAPYVVESLRDPCNLALADLDGDADLDIAVGSAANAPTANIGVHRNAGGASLSAPETHDLGGMIWGVTAADLDGDGHADLVALPDALARATILWNGGGGSFADTASIELSSPVSSAAAADIDADGDLDLVVAGGRAYAAILANAGGRRFVEASRLEPGREPRWVLAPDLNGDGLPDILVLNQGSHDLTLFLNNGRGMFAEGRGAPLSRWWRPRFLSRL